MLLLTAPCREAAPCSGQECAAETKTQVTGNLEDDVVSLLHVTGKPHHRSQQAQNAGKTTQDDQQMSDTDEASLLGLENQLLKPSSSSSGSSTRLESSEDGMIGSMWHIVGVLFTIVILGLVVRCLPQKSLAKLYEKAKDTSIRQILSPFQLFTQEYLNRLMLMMGAAILLNAGGAFVHLFMPDNAKGWELWQVIVFTVVAVLFMLAFAFGFGYIKDCILATTTEGTEAHKSMKQLLEQTETIIMVVNGSILASVWLMRYPIPPHVPFWAPCLIFLGVVWICIGFELIKVCIGVKNKVCYLIMSCFHNVIFGTFTFILVGFLVADVRALAGYSAKDRPELWLAIVCMIATLICVFTSPFLLTLRCCCLCRQQCCCWCSDEDDPSEDKKPAEPKADKDRGLGEWFGMKSLTLLNNIFLFTTGTIIFQILTMTDEYQANVWWLSFLFILVGAGVLVLLPLAMLGCAEICSCFSEEVRVSTTNLFTTLTGWTAGKMIGACFALLITGVDRLVWLPIGIGFLLLAVLFEFVRQKIYGCLKDATEASFKDDE